MRAWLALVTGALAVACGVMVIQPWGPGRDSSGGGAESAALPDAPSAEERGLLAQLDAAPGGDPARALGDYYVDSARPFGALWAYGLALRAQPADWRIHQALAQALESSQFYDEAIARLREALLRAPGEAGARTQLVELYLKTGRPEAALTAVRGAGAAFTGSKEGAVLEGRVRQALGDASGASAAYSRAVLQDANDAGIRHRIGVLALLQGESFAAQQAFGAARIMAPEDPRHEVDLGRTFAASARAEERDRAPELYARAISRDVRYGPAHYATGVWYLRRSRWREAIERLQTAVEIDPGDAEAHERLAEALEATGQRAEAHRRRGLAYEARHLRIAALREYQAWAALDRGNPEAAVQVAQSFFDVNRREEARARLEGARGRYPRDAAIRERLIAYYILGRDLAPARRLCEEWLREEPGSAQVLWLLGRVAAAEQRWSEAVRWYEQARAREPDDPRWLGTLGEALLREAGTGAAPRAMAALARAATAAPDDPRWRLGLAQALLRLGRVEEARRQALRALDLDPRQRRAYSLVLQCARQERGAARAGGPAVVTLFAGLLRTAEVREREEAALWQAAWTRPRDPGAYAALAGFLIRHGELAAAEGQLAEAVRLRPASGELRARLAGVRRLRAVL